MCAWCYDSEPHYWKRCELGPGVFRSAGIRYLKVKRDVNDESYITSMFFISTDEQDTVTDYETFRLMEEYKVFCKVLTTKRVEDIPTELTGYLHPQDDLNPTQITFGRWPEGDFVLPCFQDFPYRLFGYKSNEAFTPPDLFPHIEPEEWGNITKYISSFISGRENGMLNDGGVTGIVMSGLQLDCTNDSTVCFIPAADEKMDFIFRYGRDMGFDETTDIRFRTRESDEFGEPSGIVYEEPVLVRDVNVDPNEWDIPGIPMPNYVNIKWDGRGNSGLWDGQLVYPHSDPFRATVDVFPPEDPDNPSLSSNTEEFDAVPMIDSVLVTHHPFYPPTDDDYTSVYAVIRGKIDDSSNPLSDYRYYIPFEYYPGEYPDHLDFWVNEQVNENFKFWDANNNDNLHRKFYENNDAQGIVFDEWHPSNFGLLDYRWLVVKDQRIRRTNQVSYENVVDTTSYIEDFWKVDFWVPPNWTEPRTIPYMRLLLYPEIKNTKSGYVLQTGKGADGPDAHKVIFMFDWWRTTEIDLADWATSHIGVPYVMDMRQKIPYISNDCASLVTTCRIQQLGPEVGDYLSIAKIWSYVYYRGYLNEDHPEIRFTEIVPNPALDPDLGPGLRGLLLFIYDRTDPDYNQTPPDWDNVNKHIMIVYYLTSGADGIPSSCQIVHARGGSPMANGRVRYDDARSKYPPYYDIRGYRDHKWVWTFIKFLN